MDPSGASRWVGGSGSEKSCTFLDSRRLLPLNQQNELVHGMLVTPSGSPAAKEGSMTHCQAASAVEFYSSALPDVMAACASGRSLTPVAVGQDRNKSRHAVQREIPCSLAFKPSKHSKPSHFERLALHRRLCAGGVLEVAERRDGQQRVPRHVPVIPAASLAGHGGRPWPHVSPGGLVPVLCFQTVASRLLPSVWGLCS